MVLAAGADHGGCIVVGFVCKRSCWFCTGEEVDGFEAELDCGSCTARTSMKPGYLNTRLAMLEVPVWSHIPPRQTQIDSLLHGSQQRSGSYD